jgi:hypothetical protein
MEGLDDVIVVAIYRPSHHNTHPAEDPASNTGRLVFANFTAAR